MSATAADLIDEVRSRLNGDNPSGDQITALSAGMSASDMSFTVVDSGSMMSAGIGVIEIDSEQILVKDVTSGVCTVADFIGRGFAGTTPASHSAGTLVVTEPRVTRSTVLRVLNEVIGDLRPDLYRVGQVETTTDTGGTVTLPVDVQRVVDLRVLYDTAEHPLSAWRLRRTDSDVVVETKVGSGVDVRVTYALPLNPFSAETVTIEDTGLSEICRSLLISGALLKIIPGTEFDRLQTTRVEESDRSVRVPASAGLTASRFVAADYDRYLNIARRELRGRFPVRIVRSW